MALHTSDVKVGDTRTAVVVDNLSRTQIVQYAGASGDYNPSSRATSCQTAVPARARPPARDVRGVTVRGVSAREPTGT